MWIGTWIYIYILYIYSCIYILYIIYSTRTEVQIDLNVLRNSVCDKDDTSNQRGNHKLFNKWHWDIWVTIWRAKVGTSYSASG